MEALYETWIPTFFCEGISFTFMLSLHLLSLCTYFESIVTILSSMCIVPRLVDWCIDLILIVLNYLYLVTLVNFEGVLCIYFLLYEGQAECHYAMFSVCETNKRLAKHCYSWIFCLCPFMLQLSCFVLLLELCLSCYDWSTMIPALNVYKYFGQVFDGACHLKNYSFFLSLTYSRTSRS